MQGKGVKLEKEHWYKHVPESSRILHEGKVDILGNQQVKTDRTSPKNKPDVIIHDKGK
jgi:hypothetical protein